MNDPGLEENIANGARHVEKAHRQQAEGRDGGGGGGGGKMEETHNSANLAYLVPSRWWFASTAFPLLAGTFGPMASAFSVCALVVEWRVEVPPGGTEIHGVKIPDPRWLIAVNAVSLFLALIANMALLLNMARRVSFPVAQPITIVGWYLSSFLLIILISLTSTTLRLPSPPAHAHTQAFYYAILAASLYFIVASLMVVTVWGAHAGHYSKDFKLTMSQRTLMLQTISFLVYLLGGAAIFARVEGWNYLDGVYWADFTLLTVGIGGDLVPKTHLARSLLFPYAVGGIVTLGLVVGSIRSLVLERGKKKLGARMVEKHRHKTLKRMAPADVQMKLVPVTTSTVEDVDTADSQTELERREAEFLLMRRIQDEAANTRRWTSLAFSGSIWVALWLVGAVVFWQSERKGQQWTYFSGVYFAYTSLLTIGYGDLTLMSNSGKPFFVFWSLCAVPSLTILISNMGDTVIAVIRDGTIWLGNLTVLPGESGVLETFKLGVKRIVSFTPRSSKKKSSAPPPKKADGDDHSPSTLESNPPLKRSHSFPLSISAASLSRLTTSPSYRNYLVACAIQRVLMHLPHKPPVKYSYDEWVFFLRLIGEDEAHSATHRAAIPRHHGRRELLELQSAVANDLEGEALSRLPPELAKDGKWSWLGYRSPLLGEQSESEWLLERLTGALRGDLKALCEEEEGNGGQEEGRRRTSTGEDAVHGT